MAAQADAAAQLTIGTHSGNFQCDEALGVWMLRQLPKWRDSALIRSRDHDVLDTCDIVIDVDGVYDHSKLRYDHHQRGFFETFDGEPGIATDATSATGEFKTKLSACGLVYKHYGREILTALYPELEGPRLEAIYIKLYSEMIEGLDAIDNGIEVSEEPRYREGTHLSKKVLRMNPKWNQPKVDQKAEDAKFELASAKAGEEFMEQLEELVTSWLPARDEVNQALNGRLDIHTTGEVIKVDQHNLPWKDHLYDLEREQKLETLVKFVLYEDIRGMWRVQAVTAEGTLFTNRLGLPEPWRGLKDADLCAAVGLDGCKFVHNAGFIGGHDTYEGALTMALRALEAH